MFVCYVCSKSEPTLTKFRSHLQRHHVVGELTYPALCCFCKSSFATVYNLIRHVNSFHGSVENDMTVCGVVPLNTVEFSCNNDDMECIDDADTHVATECDLSDMHGDLRAEGISLVAGLRANSSIPFSVVPGVVQSFNQMSSSLVSLVQAETLNCLVSSGVESSLITDVKTHLDAKLYDCREPLEFLSSRYKQDGFFDSHELAVKPETVVFGTNFCSRGGTSRLVYDSFQYVSVQKTLHSLMQNRSFVEIMLEDRCVPGIIEEFVDGDKYKTHPLFSDSSKLSVMIQLFYDGLGVTNPLRGHSTLHNVGVFFYTIKNIAQQFNSCFANVHLLALCKSKDLKKYGFEPVLQKFVAEMTLLGKNGFTGEFPVIGEQTVYASLCQVTCDNLALNGILGFIESFSSDHYCTVCYATQDEIQVNFREELFQRRTLHEYNEDVSTLNQGPPHGKNHVRGVKFDCVLNEIDGYHVTENWSLDIMHIILEGIVPLEIGCILHGLCVVDKVISFYSVNCKLQLFWGRITVEKTHKPLQLAKLMEPGQGLNPTMKALQYWTLLKYLPLALGGSVSDDNKHWHFLLHLSHVVDLIFAPKFTHAMVCYMRSVIEDHLTQYVQLYGNNDGVRVRPKHHFLVHLPSIVLKSGPLVGMSCLRYELKNSFFKRSANTVCNFTNICRTLAHRHQQRALYSLLSNAHCRKMPVVARQNLAVVSSLTFGSLLCDKLGLMYEEQVAVAVKLCMASVEYRQGSYIVIDICAETGDLIFGRIVNFVSCSHSDEWYIVVECLKTLEFWAHFHAYAVRHLLPAVFRVLAVDEMLDHHPLYCHSAVTNGVQQRLIRAPYHIFKP